MEKLKKREKKNCFIKNKKGSHVGMILSFGIFITFIIFLYIVVEPALQTGEEHKPLMNRLKPEAIDRVSANFTTMTIRNSSVSKRDCILINNYNYSDMNSTIVKDSQGNIVKSNITNGDLYIKVGEGGVFKIYSASVSLNSGSFDTSTCESTISIYERGIHRKEKIVSDREVKELINDYKSNYTLVKNSFDIPDNRNFGIDFIYSNHTHMETSATNLTRDVFIEKVSIQYFNKNAEKRGGFLKVKVW